MDTHVLEHLKDYENDHDIRALNIPGAVEEAVKAKNALALGLEDMRKWMYGCDFVQKKKDFEPVMKAFKDKLQIVLDLDNCLCNFDNDKVNAEKAEDKSGQRKNRYDKVKLQAKLQGGCPSLFGKFLAARIGDDRVLRTSVGYNAEFNDALDFNRPKMFSSATDGSASSARPSTWHQQLESFVNTNLDVLTEKKEKTIRKLLKEKKDKGKDAATHAFQALDFEPLDHHVGEIEVLKPTADVPPILFVQKNDTIDVRPEGMPLLGAGVFITISMGNACIFALPLNIVADAGARNVKSFLEVASATHSARLRSVTKCPCFVISQGESVWVPFGHAPVIVGLNDAKDPDPEDNFLSYVLHAVLQDSDGADIDADAVNTCLVHIGTGATLAGPKFEATRAGIAKWKAALEKKGD